jgi:hypothetical protein
MNIMENSNFTIDVSATSDAVSCMSWLNALIARWERKLERWDSPDSSVRHSQDGKQLIRTLLQELRADRTSASNAPNREGV